MLVMTSVHISSGLVLHLMTSIHISLGLVLYQMTSVHISLVLHLMMSDHNSSDLAPQRQDMSVENVSSGL
ncbi:hypothetical protein Tco_0243984, partial [Tanacetum coccineum]